MSAPTVALTAYVSSRLWDVQFDPLDPKVPNRTVTP